MSRCHGRPARWPVLMSTLPRWPTPLVQTGTPKTLHCPAPVARKHARDDLHRTPRGGTCAASRSWGVLALPGPAPANSFPPRDHRLFFPRLLGPADGGLMLCGAIRVCLIAGVQLDVCYFKKPAAMNGAITSMGDNTVRTTPPIRTRTLPPHRRLRPTAAVVLTRAACRGEGAGDESTRAWESVPNARGLPTGGFSAVLLMPPPKQALVSM